MTLNKKFKLDVQQKTLAELETFIEQIPTNSKLSIFEYLFKVMEEKSSKEYVKQYCLKTLKKQKS